MNEKGWELSPAYDLNPSIEKDGLALNIDMDDNALNFELAKSVGKFFRLNENEMDTIIKEVLTAVRDWKSVAKLIGIPNREQLLMEPAFNTAL